MKIPKWMKDEDGDDGAEQPEPEADDEESDGDDEDSDDEHDAATYPLW